MKRVHLLLTLTSTVSALAIAIGCGGGAPTATEESKNTADPTTPVGDAPATTPPPPSTPAVPSTPPSTGANAAKLTAGLYTTSHVDGVDGKCDYQITPTFNGTTLTSVKVEPKNFGCAGDFTATCGTSAMRGGDAGPPPASSSAVTCSWTTGTETRQLVDLSATSYTQVYGDGTRFTFVNTTAPTQGTALAAALYKGTVKDQPTAATCDLTLTNVYAGTTLSGVLAARSNCQTQDGQPDTGKEAYACDASGKLCTAASGAQTRTLTVATATSFTKTTTANGSTSAFTYTQAAAPVQN